MKCFALILALMSLYSCGPLAPKEKKSVKIAAEAKAYVSAFEEKRGKKIDNLEVTFVSNLQGNVLAYCGRGEKTVIKIPQNDHYDIRQVVISKEWWDKMPEADKEVLIFHELGHCVLDRGHTDSRLASGRPASVMNTYHIGGGNYTSIYGYYLSELFNKPALATASFSSSAYKVASTMQASTMMEEDEEEVVVHEPVGELHNDCVHDVGHIVVDETTAPESEETSTED